MSFSMVVKFSQIMLKTFTRAVDSVISYIAKVINTNYNSNMCCCMNNKQLIQLYTPNCICINMYIVYLSKYVSIWIQ